MHFARFPDVFCKFSPERKIVSAINRSPYACRWQKNHALSPFRRLFVSCPIIANRALFVNQSADCSLRAVSFPHRPHRRFSGGRAGLCADHASADPYGRPHMPVSSTPIVSITFGRRHRTRFGTGCFVRFWETASHVSRAIVPATPGETAPGAFLRRIPSVFALFLPLRVFFRKSRKN